MVAEFELHNNPVQLQNSHILSHTSKLNCVFELEQVVSTSWSIQYQVPERENKAWCGASTTLLVGPIPGVWLYFEI